MFLTLLQSTGGVAPGFTGWRLWEDDDDDDSGHRKKKRRKRKRPEPTIVTFMNVLDAIRAQESKREAEPEVIEAVLPEPQPRAVEKKVEQVRALPLGPSIEQLNGVMATLAAIREQILEQAEIRAAQEQVARQEREQELAAIWAQKRIEAIALRRHLAQLKYEAAERERLQLEEDELVVELLQEFMGESRYLL